VNWARALAAAFSRAITAKLRPFVVQASRLHLFGFFREQNGCDALLSNIRLEVCAQGDIGI
jgi:hypothetical protein